MEKAAKIAYHAQLAYGQGHGKGRGGAANQGGGRAGGGDVGRGARSARVPRGGGGGAAASAAKTRSKSPESTDRSGGGGAGPTGTVPTRQAVLDKGAALHRQAKRIMDSGSGVCGKGDKGAEG